MRRLSSIGERRRSLHMPVLHSTHARRTLCTSPSPSTAPRALLPSLDMIDFGCGTGLLGVVLRARCKGRMLGCDLSPGMLREATKRHAGLYDDLAVADCVSYLRSRAARASEHPRAESSPV